METPSSSAPVLPAGAPPNLAADVDGAFLLRSYAAQAALDVPDDVTRTVARSRQLLGQAQLQGDALSEFYAAFGKLAAVASPVTVASLRAAAVDPQPVRTGMWQRRRQSPAQNAMNWYWRWTLAFLAVLVVVQIHWVVGSLALDSVQKWQEERGRVTNEYNLRREKLAPGAKPTPEMLQMEAVKLSLAERITAYSQILVGWNEVWNSVWSTWKRFWAFITLQPAPAAAAQPPVATAAAEPEKPVDANSTLGRTRFILVAMQTYLLPLLYGLLGACTYVLRTLSRDVRSLSYTPDSHVRYKIRLVLGTLSGLAITWVFEPGGEVVKLSPLALAFIAGYSVEILFAAMDRFVGAFTGTAGTLPPPAGKPDPAR